MIVRDVSRSGTSEEALARARAARRLVMGGHDLVLSLTRVTDERRIVGAFSPEEGALRRQTGGPPWRLREGTHFLRVALRHPSVLMATPDDKILNRNLRPLLAALRKCGPLAMYGGRDFISANGEIVALVAWGRGIGGEVILDAAIATDASVLDAPEPPEVARAHLGKSDRPFADLGGLPEQLARAYAPSADEVVLEDAPLDPPLPTGRLLAAREVAIGRLSLHEPLALRGDFFADDRLSALPLAELVGLPEEEQVERLTAERITVEGIRDWPHTVAALLSEAART